MKCINYPAPAPAPKTGFSSLPAELRHLIWLATFETRILTIAVHNGDLGLPCHPKPSFSTFTATLGIEEATCQQETTAYCEGITYRCTCAHRLPPGPVALYVCRESRDNALERYQRAFGGETCVLNDFFASQNWIGKGYGKGKIWVDFKRDVFFFNQSRFIGSLMRISSPERMKIKTMAIVYDNSNRRPWERVGLLLRDSFNYWSLKTIRVYIAADFGTGTQRMFRMVADVLKPQLLWILTDERTRRLPWVIDMPDLELHPLHQEEMFS